MCIYIYIYIRLFLGFVEFKNKGIPTANRKGWKCGKCRIIWTTARRNGRRKQKKSNKRPTK